MTFSEKLIFLRRSGGMSQEQLAEKLGVTRQSVSKWESGAATPEIGKLVALSELFQVSVDYLVKEYITEPERLCHPEHGKETPNLQAGVSLFSYTSKTKLFDIPLVSVRFGRERYPDRNNTGRGIVAVGNFAVGVVAVGLISLGVVSVGMVAFGVLLALGMVSVGTVAVGFSALGVWSLGLATVAKVRAHSLIQSFSFGRWRF